MDRLRNYRSLKIAICLIPREIILQMTILKPHLQEPVALINNLIFFMFISFPAILLVKRICSQLNNSINEKRSSRKSALGILYSDFQQNDVTSKSTLQNRALRHCKERDVGSV